MNCICICPFSILIWHEGILSIYLIGCGPYLILLLLWVQVHVVDAGIIDKINILQVRCFFKNVRQVNVLFLADLNFDEHNF